MAGIQEAKYIQVIWQDRATARKVVESRDSLRLEPIDKHTIEVEIVSYSRIDDGSPGQFAVRLDTQSFDVPRVEQVNGISMDLLPVTDPVTGLRWWVEGKTWDNKRGRWLSDIYRGVGEVRIKVGVQSCRVKVSTSTFTYQELERYLTDFQTDFWELILDDVSYISAAARRNQQSLLDEATMCAIAKFIECVELALQNPKVELREVQSLKPRKDVRPVPRTFMEMATRGSIRTLTSRAYQESLDLPENRYAHHALRKVYQITKALCTVAASQARSLERSLEAHRQRLSNFSNLKIINKDAVMHDLMDKERAIVEIASRISKQNVCYAQMVCQYPATGQEGFRGKRVSCLRALLSERADKIPGNPFFVKIRSNENKPWYEFPDGGYATLELGVFSNQGDPGSEYEILGEIDYTIIPGSSRPRHNFELLTVTQFKLVKSLKHESLIQRLDAAQQQVRDLENCGWQRSLTKDEVEQQKREVGSIEKIIVMIMNKQKILSALSRELAPKLPALRAALRIFEKDKVKLDSRFPNSMTYVQNPAYQGIHATFSKIKEGSGINDDEILLAMDRIEEIGLVNISMLYERWCLLQIIKVLVRFRYLPEHGWKRKLITQVLDHGRNVAIDFENSGLRRKLTLTYEMELENGKRPDFVLDVSANCNDAETRTTKRFVMDAKFYQDINNDRHGGLRQVVNELYNDKNYAEGGQNAVFILHPSSKAAPSRATPQEWSRDNYYGEVPLFDWDNSPPDHRYGGIFLSPISNGSYLDPLQRAIGMFLQYGMENNDTKKCKHGALTENGVFCLVCGSSDVSCRQSPINPKAWWTTCNDCNHFTTYNYCRECDNRLIKNGEYWSYHSVEPLNPINIKCPSCGGLL